MKEETWATIAQFSGYEISNRGRVRSLSKLVMGGNGPRWTRTRILKKQRRFGYEIVKIRNKSLMVHRLIAFAFIPNPMGFPHINHINGIRGDNRPENLEWVTSKMNNHHRIHVLQSGLGSNHGRSVITEADVPEIRRLRNAGMTQLAIAHKYRVHRLTIRALLIGKTWAHVA